MVMASVVGKTGTVVAPGMGSILVSPDGVNYAAADGVRGIAQTADVYGTNKDQFAIAGSWQVTDPNTGRPTGIYGVASSTYNGATFTISSNVPDGFVRYGAYPSDNVWYVASGMWGSDPSVSKSVRALSSRVKFDSFNGKTMLDFDANKHHKMADTNSTGWFGSVSKSVDGGRSWKQVLTTNLAEDYVYFNEISCSSELNCIVVGEGDTADGQYYTVAYTTFDGGNTWEKTFSSTAYVSLTSVVFSSATDAWIAPCKKSGRTLSGQFMKSTDGGKTFSLVQSLDNCYAIDLDFSQDGAGYAACLSSSGSSGSVATYK